MIKKSVNTFKGLRVDESKFKYNPQFYFDAKNMRIFDPTEELNGSIKNEKGNLLKVTIPSLTWDNTNKRYSYYCQTGTTGALITPAYSYKTTRVGAANNIANTNFKIIGSCETKDGSIFFVKDNSSTPEKYNSIWRLYCIGQEYKLQLVYLALDTDMPFYLTNEIDSIAYYENSKLYKIYWIDGVSQPKFLNFHYDFADWAAGTSPDYSPLNVNPDMLNFVPKITKGNIAITKSYGLSALKAGVIQFAYNLYSLNGQQSKVAGTTDLFELDSQNKGGAVNEQSNSVFKLNITLNSLDASKYNGIKIYAIKRETKDGNVNIECIYDLKVSSQNISVSYNGYSFVENVAPATFFSLGGEYIIPKTMATRENRIFFANYSVDDIELYSNVKAFSFINNPGLDDENNEIYVSQVKSGGSYELAYYNKGTDSISEELVLNLDNINYDYGANNFNPSSRWTLGNHDHRFGALGENVEVRVLLKEIANGATNKAAETYMCGQIYRLGIECFDEYGRSSPVAPICDIKIPYQIQWSDGTQFVGYGYSGGNPYDDNMTGGQWSDTMALSVVLRNKLYFKNTDGSQGKEVSSWRLVRCEVTQSNRNILTTGIINSTIFEGKDRNDKTYYAMPDYFQRYLASRENRTTPSYVNVSNYGSGYWDIYNYSFGKEYMCHWRRLSFPRTEFEGNFNANHGKLRRHTGATGDHNCAEIKFEYDYSKSGATGYDTDTNYRQLFWANGDYPSSQYSRTIYMDSNLLNLYSPEIIFNDIQSLDTSFVKIDIIGKVEYCKASDGGRQTRKVQRIVTDTNDILNYGNSQSWGYDDVLEYITIGFRNGFEGGLDYGNIDRVCVAFNLNNPTDISDSYYKEKYSSLIEELNCSSFLNPINCNTSDIKLINSTTGSTSYNNHNYRNDCLANVYSEITPNTTGIYSKICNHVLFDLGSYFDGTDTYLNSINCAGGVDFGPIIWESNTIVGYSVNGRYNYNHQNYIGTVNKASNILYRDSSNVLRPYGWYEKTASPPEMYGATGYTSKQHALLGRIEAKSSFYTSQYGGQLNDVKNQNDYIPCSDIAYNIIGSSVLSTNGDAWIGRIILLRSFSGSPESDVPINRTIFSAEAVSYFGETWINIEERNDDSKEKQNVLNIFPDEFYKYNTVYSQANNFIKAFGLDSRFISGATEAENTVITTNPKITGEFIDSWSDVLVDEFLTIEGNYGPINKLQEFQGQLYALQTKALCHLIVLPRIQIPASDGKNIETGTGTLFEGYRYLNTLTGCSNKWSVSKSQFGFYYYDNINKTVFFSSGVNNPVVDLGIKTGTLGIFNNKVNDGIADNPMYGTGVRSFYNPQTKDIYFTWFNLDSHAATSGYTLSFNEATQSFTSFYSYLPSMYAIAGNNMLSTTIQSDITGAATYKLYEHFTGNHNVFYGQYFQSDITISNNPEPFAEKTFTNLEFENDVFLKDINNIYQDNASTFTAVRTISDYQDSGEVPLSTSYYNRNLQRKFRTWRIIMPRQQSSIQRMKDHYIKTKLIFNKNNAAQDYKMILHDIITSYVV